MPLTSGGLSTGKLRTGSLNDKAAKANAAAGKRGKAAAEKRAAAKKKRVNDAKKRDADDRAKRREIRKKEDWDPFKKKGEDQQEADDKARDENQPDGEQPEKEKGTLKGFRIGAIKYLDPHTHTTLFAQYSSDQGDIYNALVAAWTEAIELGHGAFPVDLLNAYAGTVLAIANLSIPEVRIFAASKSEKAEMDR